MHTKLLTAVLIGGEKIGGGERKQGAEKILLRKEFFP